MRKVSSFTKTHRVLALIVGAVLALSMLLGAAFVSTLPVIATVFVSYPELARNALKALKAADQRIELAEFFHHVGNQCR